MKILQLQAHVIAIRTFDFSGSLVSRSRWIVKPDNELLVKKKKIIKTGKFKYFV